MQIAETLSGHTLAEADLLRRAMGQQLPTEVAKQRTAFILGAAHQRIPETQALMLFNWLAESTPAISKSYVTSYSLIVYQMAWLQAHFPLAEAQ